MVLNLKFSSRLATKNKNKNMSNLKILIRVSLALFLVNLALVGLVSFNHFKSRIDLTNASQDTSQNEVKGVSNIPVFDPSNVISDEAFKSTRACGSVAAIQDILEAKNSPLKSYSVQGRSSSYWIYAASRGETSSQFGITPQINPCVLLAYLEKEQSLLTGQFSTTQLNSRLDVAMGYGCPDSAGCNAKYKGFVNQLNWAAYQLQYNYNLATNSKLTDSYQVGRTIFTLDSINVFLSNSATAAAYRYTPHVYWGNYNLWKIMTSNGWGVSGNTYTYAQLDGINIPNKANIIANEQKNRIKEADVADLISTPPAIGTTSDRVKLLQQFLRQEGYFTYPVNTGFYGSVTETARKSYIADNPERIQRASTCDPLYKLTYKIGQKDANVTKLQECLKAENLFAWPTITGQFGAVTEQGLSTIRSRKGFNSATTTPPVTPTPSTNTTTSTPNPEQNTATTPTPAPTTASSVKLKTNSRGVNAKSLNFRDKVCGTQIGTVNWNTEVSKVEGPIRQSCFGGTWDWYKVNLNGKSGWVAGFYLDVVSGQSNSNQKFATVRNGDTAASLNVRNAPCGGKINSVNWGTQVIQSGSVTSKTCFGRNFSWTNVLLPDGTNGWVASNYLQKV